MDCSSLLHRATHVFDPISLVTGWMQANGWAMEWVCINMTQKATVPIFNIKPSNPQIYKEA